jgi:hypothetical protein
VLDEFRRVRDYFATHHGRSSNPDVRKRSARLVGELEKLDPGTIKELWIG